MYVLDCSVVSEVCIDAMLHAHAFDVLAQALYIWYGYLSLVCVVVLVVAAFVLVPCVV